MNTAQKVQRFARILELRRAGWTVDQIAAQVDLSVPSISRLLHEAVAAGLLDSMERPRPPAPAPPPEAA